jgi:Gpi18-like mannosyltransferase
MAKKENNVIWDFIDNHTNIVYLIIITILALIARVVVLDYYSGDFTMFLSPWFNELKLNGGLLGLSKDIGNYTPIYMTILSLLTYLPIKSVVTIKLVSIIFDFIGAAAAYKIVKELLSDKKYKDKVSLIIYALFLLLKTVLLNSSYWAQCDSIYTAFVLISILYLIKKKYKLSIIFFGIALSFKFQAIFIFPLYVLMYIAERKIKFRYFLYIPLVIFILSIPKVIFSHDLLVGFRVYFEQAGTYSRYATLNFPNIYGIFLQGDNSNLIVAPFKEISIMGIIVTFSILVTLAYIVYTKKIKFDKNAIIDFALLSVLLTTFFLPQMHERYLFMGDVIALLYVVINIKKYYVPVMIEFISLNGYMYLLFSGFAINFSTLSIAFLVLIVLYCKDMYVKYLKL